MAEVEREIASRWSTTIMTILVTALSSGCEREQNAGGGSRTA